MIGTLLGDPDAVAMEEFCLGTRLGVNMKLPRTPAVWPPKKRWPLPAFDEETVSEINGNYPSVAFYKAALLEDLADQRRRGWLVDYSLKSAREKFGPISVAPLAIISEKGDKLRTLLDASNKVQINHRIHLEDAEMLPTSLDVQAAISVDSEL
jgi:hypothetical protein